MFVVSYNFKIHPDKNQAFEKAWKEVTYLIYRYSGSLGSRLYKSGENMYFGIAQWPDKATWENSDVATFDTHQWRVKLRECCESIETVNELELIHDLWAKTPFSE